MNIEEKISNIFWAFKFALLDHLYSKNEIIEIIRNNEILLRKVGRHDLNADSLKEIIEQYSINGDNKESSKILFELIRKKIVSEDAKLRPWAILKTIETLTWLRGLEGSKNKEIQYLIEFYEEVENSEFTPAIIKRCEDCVSGYERFDVKLYIENC
ncbi:hypothetical protein [Flavobacterium rhizosphaerae]|uniref:Uncharacterized protein n=1 Tax=Flavobacterium rhizosphaerae TaxID=3163298 RepID=A0ABW8YVX7_9FLAO